MSFWERFKARPIVASLASLVALFSSVAVAVGLIESVWSLFSSDPAIPVLGEWVRRWSAGLMQAFLLLGLAGLLGWLVYVQYRIFSVLRGPRMVQDELPGNLTVVGGKLNAGTDFTITLRMEGADTAGSVRFSARQDDLVVARNKRGHINQDGVFEFPLTAKETQRIKSGYMLVQATYVTKEGQTATLDPVVVKTGGRIL